MQNLNNQFTSLPGSVSGTGSSQSKVRRVLGIDPGLANTGFGIVDYLNGKYRMVCYGVIETKAHAPHGERLLTIYNRLCAVINEFNPSEAAMESLYFAKNASSAMTVSEAKGVVTLCLAQHCISLNEYRPVQIKQAVTGSVEADKDLVEKYVKILLGLQTVPKPDHAADALAGAITHLHYNPILKNQLPLDS